jgi:hypothetical protein
VRSLRLAVLAAIVPIAASAQQHPQTRQGFGISLGVGPAGVRCSGCSGTISGNHAAFYARYGFYVNPRVFLGFEGSRWTSGVSWGNERVDALTGVAQWYPNVARGLYVKLGIGTTKYTAEPDSIAWPSSNTSAISVGAGYDLRFGKNFSLTPYANFHASGKGELLMNDVPTGSKWSSTFYQIGVGFTWH